MHACIHTYMHAYIHPYIHTYIHTYIYIHVICTPETPFMIHMVCHVLNGARPAGFARGLWMSLKLSNPQTQDLKQLNGKAWTNDIYPMVI